MIVGGGGADLAITTFKRYEKKFIITKEQQKLLLPAVNEHMSEDPYCLDGKSYRLLNLYFDDDENSVIINSIMKPKYKEKLRLRCYGVPENGDSTVYFEIKSKLYGIVAKRRVGMKYSDALEYIKSGRHPETDVYIYNQVLDEIDELRKRKPCHPRIIIAYDRTAYFQRDRRSVRLTFDENIVTNRENLDILGFDGGKDLLPPGYLILEVKTPDTIPLWMSKAFSEAGVFMTSFSKYGREYRNTYSQI